MFQKQLMMRRVVYSLIPLFLFSMYLYGWRPLAVAALVFMLGIATEFIMVRGLPFLRKSKEDGGVSGKKPRKKVSEAVLVTCALFTLAMPPGVPLWIAAIGIIFAVLMGKGVYGGFGRNVFNPAITGRLFIYITFPTVLANAWMAPGAFGSGLSLAASSTIDGVTAATPLAMMREGTLPEFWKMLIGLRSGSMGEGPVILIVLAAVYLIYKKTASWKIILSTLLSAGIFASIFYFADLTPIPPHYALVSGSLLFVAVFMTTDPVSAPNKPMSQWLYGALIGSVAIIIRTFSAFPEGTSFGILVGNTFASLIDEIVPKKKKAKRRAKA